MVLERESSPLKVQMMREAPAGEAEGEDPAVPAYVGGEGLSLAVPTPTATPLHPPTDAPVAAIRKYLDSMPQHPSPRKEVTSGVVWRSVRGEVVASFLMTFVTSSAALQPPQPSLMAPCAQPVGGVLDGTSDAGWGWAVRWAVGHGLAMGALSWAVRGAHMSPPTTIALLVTRRVSLLRACLHLVAQVCGALLAAPVLLGMLPRPPRPPQLAPHLTAVQGWGAEFLATLMVTLITLSAYEASHNPPRHSKDSSWHQTTPTFSPNAALPVAAAHVAAALFSAEFTGVGLNPARSLALASVTGAWACHWVFWVGPALGGLLAAFTHEYTATKDDDDAFPPYQQPHLERDTSRPSAITSALASPC